jgi:hypothetical protein
VYTAYTGIPSAHHNVGMCHLGYGLEGIPESPEMAPRPLNRVSEHIYDQIRGHYWTPDPILFGIKTLFKWVVDSEG